MSRAKDAVISLYESADLRGELMDDDAETLLHWTESEIARLDLQAADDSEFEASMDALHRVVKGMNRVVGKRADMTPDEANAALDKIAGASGEIGRPVTRAGLVGLGVPPIPSASSADETLRADTLRDGIAFALEAPLPAPSISDSDVLDTLLVWVSGMADTITIQLNTPPPLDADEPPIDL